MVVYLAGNRVDLAEDQGLRQVTPSQAIKLCKEKELHNFYETSAKTGLNVEELFHSLTKHLYLNNKAKLDNFVRAFYTHECSIERKGGRKFR